MAWSSSFGYIEIQNCHHTGIIELTTVFGRGVDSKDDWVRERLREVDLGVRQRPLPRRDRLLLAAKYNVQFWQHFCQLDNSGDLSESNDQTGCIAYYTEQRCNITIF